MPGLGKSDPRYDRWRQVVKMWRKHGHDCVTPILITPSELEELEDIFPVHQRFQLKDSLDEVVIFGEPTNQRFVVVHGITPDRPKI